MCDDGGQEVAGDVLDRHGLLDRTVRVGGHERRRRRVDPPQRQHEQERDDGDGDDQLGQASDERAPSRAADAGRVGAVGRIASPGTARPGSWFRFRDRPGGAGAATSPAGNRGSGAHVSGAVGPFGGQASGGTAVRRRPRIGRRSGGTWAMGRRSPCLGDPGRHGTCAERGRRWLQGGASMMEPKSSWPWPSRGRRSRCPVLRPPRLCCLRS